MFSAYANFSRDKTVNGLSKNKDFRDILVDSMGSVPLSCKCLSILHILTTLLHIAKDVFHDA